MNRDHMRALAVLFTVILALLLVHTSANADATVTKCYKNNVGQRVCATEVVVTKKPPSKGGGKGGGNSGGASKCTWKGNAVPCTDPMGGTFSNGCYYRSTNPPIADVTPPPPPNWESLPGYFIQSLCFGPDGVLGSAGVSYFWTMAPPVAVAPSPRTLALRAFKTLILSRPSPGRYPAGMLQNGDPYTVVNAYTWYWTTPASFRAQSATASAAGVSSTVTVTPTALTFTPGDGSGRVSCGGPGTAWQSGDGVWAASSSGCDFRYLHSSIHSPNHEVTATYGIDWKVTWTSNNGQNGTLPNQTTTAATTFAVAEAESVVTR